MLQKVFIKRTKQKELADLLPTKRDSVVGSPAALGPAKSLCALLPLLLLLPLFRLPAPLSSLSDTGLCCRYSASCLPCSWTCTGMPLLQHRLCACCQRDKPQQLSSCCGNISWLQLLCTLRHVAAEQSMLLQAGEVFSPGAVHGGALQVRASCWLVSGLAGPAAEAACGVQLRQQQARRLLLQQPGRHERRHVRELPQLRVWQPGAHVAALGHRPAHLICAVWERQHKVMGSVVRTAAALCMAVVKKYAQAGPSQSWPAHDRKLRADVQELPARVQGRLPLGLLHAACHSGPEVSLLAAS